MNDAITARIRDAGQGQHWKEGFFGGSSARVSSLAFRCAVFAAKLNWAVVLTQSWRLREGIKNQSDTTETLELKAANSTDLIFVPCGAFKEHTKMGVRFKSVHVLIDTSRMAITIADEQFSELALIAIPVKGPFRQMNV